MILYSIAILGQEIFFQCILYLNLLQKLQVVLISNKYSFWKQRKNKTIRLGLQMMIFAIENFMMNEMRFGKSLETLKMVLYPGLLF